MELKFYNSLSKKEEIFTPIDDADVRIYVCGPTVYDYAHIGNARSFVIFDVIVRILRAMYPKVTYVSNITDVDDKIIKAASESKITANVISEKFETAFKEDMQSIGCAIPDHSPKATEHINEMINMIEQLVERDFAYISNDHVYFRVNAYSEYGKLSGKKIEDLISGSRVEISDNKENSLDFVLWKPELNQRIVGFESPWGRGRPGWHIECSAMSKKYLGESFDIHGGGVDLKFPHHENEIAQNCCANPNSRHAKYWIHNGFVTVNGEKMSKSLGNFVTVRDVVKSGVYPSMIRLALLSTHYSKPLNWTQDLLVQSKSRLEKFRRAASYASDDDIEIASSFLDPLLDNFNTPSFLSYLDELSDNINVAGEREKIRDATKLRDAMKFLNILPINSINEEYVQEMIKKRSIAKTQKNFELADNIRKDLQNRGVTLEDMHNGTTRWFEE